MPQTDPIRMGKINAASTRRLAFPIIKDGQPWLGIDTVTIIFREPDGSLIQRSAVLLEGHTWYYDTTITDFLTGGDRYLTLRVVDGSVVDTFTDDIILTVTDKPV